MDPVQNNQNQNPNIDTSVSDGSALPFPMGGEVGAVPTPPVTPSTSGSAAPTDAPAADVTGANQPTVNEVPPAAPPTGGSVIATKPTRGKIGPTGIIATIFGVLLLVGATLGGVLLVQQNQDIREKAGSDSCDWCAGADQCLQSTGSTGNDSARAKAVCGGLNCCQGFHQATSGSTPVQPPSCTGISCNGGECTDGFIFAPDSCAPQATCEQRANDACASHGGVKTADITNPSPTPGGTTGGATGVGYHAGACTSSELSNGAVDCTSSTYQFSNCQGTYCATTIAQGCSGVAQDLGCYTTGNAGECPAGAFWRKHYCENQFGLGDGCQTSAPALTTKPSFDSSFCGTQQIDCSELVNGQLIYESREDRSACTAAAATNPPATETPGGGGTTLTASCLNIKAYDTSWNQLTAQQLANLQVGSVVRFAVKGSATSGTFDKARFTINNILRPEVATTNPTDAQQFYDEYTIPDGVTTFTIGAEVHHVTLNAWR